MPGIGSSANRLPLIYRKITAGHHHIIYHYNDDQLTVVRILHERQDANDGELN